jgi:hypothetical protein
MVSDMGSLVLQLLRELGAEPDVLNEAAELLKA